MDNFNDIELNNLDYLFLSNNNYNCFCKVSKYLISFGLTGITYEYLNDNLQDNWFLLYKSININNLRDSYNYCIHNCIISYIIDRINQNNTNINNLFYKFINLYKKKYNYNYFFFGENVDNKLKHIHICIHYLLVIICQIFIKKNNNAINNISSILLIIQRFVLTELNDIIEPIFIKKNVLKNSIINNKLIYLNNLNKYNDLDLDIINNLFFVNYCDIFNQIINNYSSIDKLNNINIIFKTVSYDLNNICKINNAGADILLPILVYIIIKSKVDNLYTQLNYINEFIYNFFLDGEMGYALASLETAIEVIYNYE